MTFDDFLQQNNNKGLDFDGWYGDQCVDLVQFWSQAIGGPRFTGDAHNIYDQAGTFFDQVPNTPDAVPQKGDIVVWSGNYNGGPGHVGIAIGTGDTNTFECFEQNDPTGSPCHLKTYNYNSVLGWLHPKQLPQDQTVVIDELRKARDDNWNLYQSEVSKNNDLTKQLQDEQQKNQNLRDVLDKQTAADASLGTQLLDAQHKASDLQSFLDAVTNALGCPQNASLPEILSSIDTLRAPHDTLVKNVVPVQDALAEAAIYQRVPKTQGFVNSIVNFIINIFKK